MFRNSRSIGLMLWAVLVATAAYGLVKDVTTWRPVTDERALSVRVGDPVPDPDPDPVPDPNTQCCTPSAFVSCRNRNRFWPCVNASQISCDAPPPDAPYTYAKYGECSHTPGQEGGGKDAVCQNPDPPMSNPHCTSDAEKPSINFKVDRCTPHGGIDMFTCPMGLARCSYNYTPAGTGNNTRTVTVKACAANDTFCPQIDPQYTRCQNPDAAVPQG